MIPAHDGLNCVLGSALMYKECPQFPFSWLLVTQHAPLGIFIHYSWSPYITDTYVHKGLDGFRENILRSADLLLFIMCGLFYRASYFLVRALFLVLTMQDYFPVLKCIFLQF